jgi:hypothetical protein
MGTPRVWGLTKEDKTSYLFQGGERGKREKVERQGQRDRDINCIIQNSTQDNEKLFLPKVL